MLWNFTGLFTLEIAVAVPTAALWGLQIIVLNFKSKSSSAVFWDWIFVIKGKTFQQTNVATSKLYVTNIGQLPV